MELKLTTLQNDYLAGVSAFPIPIKEIAHTAGVKPSVAKRVFVALEKKGLIALEGDVPRVTEDGQRYLDKDIEEHFKKGLVPLKVPTKLGVVEIERTASPVAEKDRKFFAEVTEEVKEKVQKEEKPLNPAKTAETAEDSSVISPRGIKLAAIRNAFAEGAHTVGEVQASLAFVDLLVDLPAESTIRTQVSLLRKQAGLIDERKTDGPLAKIRNAWDLGVRTPREIMAAYPELNKFTVRTQVAKLRRGS